MQIMFTCLMPLWSVGGRQSQRGAALSQARSDPLLTPRWAPLSPLGSSVCCRVRQGMGLCAGFAMADLKPICGEKIGLIYHPLFTVHFLFVNPKDYILSCCHPSFLSGFHSLAHTRVHKTAKTKVFVKVRIKYSSQHWHSQSGLENGNYGRYTNKGTAPHSDSNGYGAAGGRSHGTKT